MHQRKHFDNNLFATWNFCPVNAPDRIKEFSSHSQKKKSTSMSHSHCQVDVEVSGHGTTLLQLTSRFFINSKAIPTFIYKFTILFFEYTWTVFNLMRDKSLVRLTELSLFLILVHLWLKAITFFLWTLFNQDIERMLHYRLFEQIRFSLDGHFPWPTLSQL